VVALGESRISEWTYPRLTCVAQPHAGMVEGLTRILRDVLSDPRAWDGRGIVTTPRLIVRESTGGLSGPIAR